MAVTLETWIDEFQEIAKALDEYENGFRNTAYAFFSLSDAITWRVRRFPVGPPKLCIDGHEYRRRQRRRTKGKRR